MLSHPITLRLLSGGLKLLETSYRLIHRCNILWDCISISLEFFITASENSFMALVDFKEDMKKLDQLFLNQSYPM